MVDFIFTHNSTESALRTRNVLHESLKGCDAYVNNDIVLSDGAPKCEPGDLTFKFKTKNGEEVEFKHCITLLIDSNNDNEYRQVIHVSDTNSLFPMLNGGFCVSIEAIEELMGNKEKLESTHHAKWFNF